jgi:histidinol-phosphate phosphatase family protein
MLWNIDPSWTLFLDRDGVVNVRLMGDYVKARNEFRLLPGVAEAIARANELFGRVVVVTNQQGIGKGIMTERNLLDIHTYCTELLSEEKAEIHAYYFAPHLASEQHAWRKPSTGMGYLAQQDFPEIDFSKSVMVGDSDSDIVFGEQLGMKTVFISHNGAIHPTADRTEMSLLAFIKSIEL